MSDNICTRTGVKRPLELLPEEIWELILNQVEHSQDIFSFLKAFPQLDVVFHDKKPNLLFEVVLPHIVTRYVVRKKEHETNYYWYLLTEELFNLRLVSKRWKNGVDKCIESHSDRHPISILSKNDGTMNQSETFIPEHHFSYQRMYKYHFGASVFHSPQHVDKFMEKMEGFYGNPFPGKFVFLNGFKCDVESHTLFIPKVAEMLHKFGEYIQILDLEIFHHYGSNLDNFKTILKALSYVPNLTSLTIRGRLITGEEKEDDPPTFKFFSGPESQQLFPVLPLLNTFDWQIFSSEDCSWVTRMIDTYANRNSGLRKLAIVEYYCKDQFLSNLSELHLYLDSERSCGLTSIRNILSMFPAGQLRKFCLSEYLCYAMSREIFLTELLKLLAEFQIKEVVFERIKLKDLRIEKATKRSFRDFSSITSLSLEDNLELDYHLLKFLSNLRFLHVYVNGGMNNYYCRYNPIGVNSFSTLLRTYIAQANGEVEERVKGVIPKRFSIWKELPKLEMLSASMDNTFEILDVQFFRECGNKPFYGYRPEKTN